MAIEANNGGPKPHEIYRDFLTNNGVSLEKAEEFACGLQARIEGGPYTKKEIETIIGILAAVGVDPETVKLRSKAEEWEASGWTGK